VSIVRMNELLTPESVAMKYICKRLGLNIRPEKAVHDEKEGTWVVPLRALVPSRVTQREGTSKTFVYAFGVGTLKLDENLRVIEKMGAQELEDKILSQWNDLNDVIQKEILRYAKESWGKLTFVRIFLRPIYTLVIALLDRKQLKSSEVGPDSQKWLDLLRATGYVEPVKEDTFKTTNLLTGLSEECYRKGIVRSNFDVADVVAGHLFASEYEQLRDEFRIHAPSVYVDTAKLYYVDAVNFKEIVPIQERELFLKYRQMGNRPAYEEMTKRGFSFATAVSELVSVGLLRRHEEEILGNQALFDHLVQFRDRIAPTAELVSE